LPRHCEEPLARLRASSATRYGDEAIQFDPKMDCFAALAMTMRGAVEGARGGLPLNFLNK
jgi:hypothetical protein